MITRFRLISDVKAIIYRNTISFSSPDNKDFCKAAKRLILKYEGIEDFNPEIKEVHVPGDNFRVKITSKEEIEKSICPSFVRVSSKNLPGGEDVWYDLINYTDGLTVDSGILDLLCYSNIENGLIKEYCEISVDDENYNVKFTHNNIPNYKLDLNESIRQVNVLLCKKTKNWIPGHRYDSKDDTIYYLGSFKTFIDNVKNPVFIEHPENSQTIYLYTRDIGSAKTVSEIFKNGIIYKNNKSEIIKSSYEIYYTYKQPSMVDSGEALENDFTKLEDYRSDMLYNMGTKFDKIFSDKSNKFYPNDLVSVFSSSTILFEIREKDEISINESNVESFKNFTSSVINKVLPMLWVQSSYRAILDEKKKDKLVNLFIDYINNIISMKKFSYYTQLFNYLKLDISELFLENLSGLTYESCILNNFENFSRWNAGSIFSSIQRTEKSSRYKLSITNVCDVLKDKVLIEQIISLCKYARDNGGDGISSYNIENTGTRSNPMMYEVFCVTLDDIILYYRNKGIEMPQNLKDGILNDKFGSISISVDKDGEIN